MPFVHRFLIALRTLIEDDPESQRPRRRARNSNNNNNANNRNGNRHKHASAMLLTFRDIFTTDGLNMILDELEGGRRASRRFSRNSFTRSNPMSAQEASRTRVKSISQMIPFTAPIMPDPVEETVPLLLDETSESLTSTMLVPCPPPSMSGGIFNSLLLKNRQKSAGLTVPLDTDDEDKTVKTLRRVLKWSSKKRNSVKFAVPLPREEGHVALAVVQNAVNIVKEEQRTKKKKFLWMKIC